MQDPEIQLQMEEDVKEILRECSDILSQNISVYIPSQNKYHQARLCIETETNILDEGSLFLEVIE